ncbi:MAG: hypothetical protein IJ598_03965 [Ruminococcus sp.]|nr:hypothetical protein [Ruminococcus sp.]
MKRLLMIFTSALLCMTMLVIGPAQVVASAADNNEKKYISEVKVGMGETSEQASKELLADGYTILKDDKGEYADLNKDAGAKSPLKGGPNQKIVYLGYKTTADANDAITDLAVMNMRGGYSFEDYEKLVNDHMDTRIKPFVDRFIATLTEYRENLKKPEDSANYKRANYYKTLLNKLTDDDTGDKPLGDLLVNETKYEMGDEAYNALSDEEKKNHCDILTLLMQGNGQAVMLMETLLTKSADSSDSTWLDRFKETGLDKLTEAEKKENPNMTPSEINKQLDKKYGDDARKILDKWDAFNEVLINYDNTVKNATAAKDDIKLSGKSLEEKLTDEELAQVAFEMFQTQAAMVKSGSDAENVTVYNILASIEYGDGTMLEFFERDQSEFDDPENIRELYPLVDSLTGGQLAGLDFLSIKDMVVMAISDENGFKEVNLENLNPASIYQDVNREIYEKGGVALTDAAMRAKASSQVQDTSFRLSKLCIVLWSCTAAAGLALTGSAIAWAKLIKQGAPVRTGFQFDIVANFQKAAEDRFFEASRLTNTQEHFSPDPAVRAKYKENYDRVTREQNDLLDAKNKYKETAEYQEAEASFQKTEKQYFLKSNICKYLTVGFALIGAVLAGLSIYTTITEMMAYYKVDFVPIPKYIVERADITATDQKGKPVMIQNQTAYYKSVLCNRTDGSSDLERKNHEILKDRNDLNGDVGTQWLSLYSVKYVNGLPILADSLKLKTGKGDAPEGYTTGIHRFGEQNAFNLTSKLYCYNDPNDGTYVFFKNDTSTVKDLSTTASAFSGGSLAIGAVIGLILGGVVTFAVMTIIAKKKKKKEQAQA